MINASLAQAFVDFWAINRVSTCISPKTRQMPLTSGVTTVSGYSSTTHSINQIVTWCFLGITKQLTYPKASVMSVRTLD